MVHKSSPENKISNVSSTEEAEEEDEGGGGRKASKGFSLVFDVARRFSQPLGIDLSKWEGRIIETEKGVVRLLPVSERAKQLFGEDGARSVAHQLEHDPRRDLQIMLFPELAERAAPKIRGRKQGRITAGASQEGKPEEMEIKRDHQATTLDRVHAAMLLQAGGQTNGLRALVKTEQDRGPDFLRLANALSALYPAGSEEKRLLDAMLLAVPR
ncbi:MAG: hypothetical protein HY360_20940 [Verrucomicrobia bacterium]|nr:hypothetical protein [Verrucomicrobiota bacterium]